jgi:hypothetical protein
MPYGNKDFDIEDCNGYVLCFGEDWQGRPSMFRPLPSAPQPQ